MVKNKKFFLIIINYFKFNLFNLNFFLFSFLRWDMKEKYQEDMNEWIKMVENNKGDKDDWDSSRKLKGKKN
jgi:hypothetical protein